MFAVGEPPSLCSNLGTLLYSQAYNKRDPSPLDLDILMLTVLELCQYQLGIQHLQRTCDAKLCMEYISHVPRPVCNTTTFCILRREA